MTELKTIAAAIAANADLLERQRGVPFSIAEKLTNIAERLEELADEIQVNHEAQEENAELRAQVDMLKDNALPDGYIVVPSDAWHDLVQAELERDQLKAQVKRLQDYIEDAQGFYNGAPLKARLAEPAKAAFVAGYKLCQSAQPLPALHHHNVYGFAEKYALDKARGI